MHEFSTITDSDLARAREDANFRKRLLTENASETDLDAVQRRESELLRECWRSPEHREAVQAFLSRSAR